MKSIQEQDHKKLEEIIYANRPRPRKEFVDELEVSLFKEEERNFTMPFPKILRYVASVAAILLMTITVFATGQYLLHEVLNRDVGLMIANEAGRGVNLNLEQTIDGMTVRIPWVYADSNILTVTVIVPNDSQPFTRTLAGTLIDSNGNHITNRFGGYSQVQHIGNNTTLVYYTSFDISQLNLESDVFYGQFSVPVYHDDNIENPITLTFDLEVPIEEGFTINLQQTSQYVGIDMTLESISIAPSGVIALICFDVPETIDNEEWIWNIGAYLHIDDETYFGQDSNEQIPSCAHKLFSLPPSTFENDWTIEVTSLYGRIQNVDLQAMREEAEALGATYSEDGSVHLPNNISRDLGIAQDIEGYWTFTFSPQQQ